jgi:hypothetical protein
VQAVIDTYARVGVLGGLAAAAGLGAFVALVVWLARGRRGGAVAGVAGMLGAGTVLGFMLLVDRMHLQRAEGEVVEEHVVGEGPGAMRVVVDRVPKIGLGRKKGWVYRLTAVSVPRQERTARTIVGDEPEWIGEVGGKVWMRLPDLGLHARDPVTLATVLREKELADRDPALAGGVESARVEGGQLVVVTKQGTELRLTP